MLLPTRALPALSSPTLKLGSFTFTALHLEGRAGMVGSQHKRYCANMPQVPRQSCLRLEDHISAYPLSPMSGGLCDQISPLRSACSLWKHSPHSGPPAFPEMRFGTPVDTHAHALP